MKRYAFLIVLSATLALGACSKDAGPFLSDSQISSVDAKLRDKCDYLRSGVALASAIQAFVPAVAPFVQTGGGLIISYCGDAPVQNITAAMAQMEKIIVAVRPFLAK